MDRLDLAVVARQLGRDSWRDLRTVSRIAARCPWQLPAVVENEPYDQEGRPFPTLYYLTCPTAVAAVGRLESCGAVRELGASLSADAGLRRSLVAAETYERRRRRALAHRLRPSTVASAPDGGAAVRAGIAGRGRRRATEGAALKCLHAHAAHALARPGYELGDLVLRRAEAAAALWCDDARCLRVAGRTSSRGPLKGAVPAACAGSDAVRVALVDLGTNTCRLLLGRVGSQWCGPIERAERSTTVVRLGQGVDRSGRLAPEAVLRTRACLADYAERIAQYAPHARRLIATSVLRDAGDGRDFLERVEQDFGLPWRVLSGAEEGAAAFRGAVCGWAGGPGTVLVVDIGGGSTELVAGTVPLPGADSLSAGSRRGPFFIRSVDVGAVRLTERFFRHDPPTSGEWAAAVHCVRDALRSAVPDDVRQAVEEAIGVAGTVTTLVAHKLGLREYRSEVVDGQPLRVREIEAAICAFRGMTSRQRAALPGIQPGREDVILAGALIAREVCRAFGLSGVWCGESDILEGAALELADDYRSGRASSR